MQTPSSSSVGAEVLLCVRSTGDLVEQARLQYPLNKEHPRSGFTFVGTTICYAFMQAVGMVNDHIVECFRWQEVQLPAR